MPKTFFLLVLSLGLLPGCYFIHRHPSDQAAGVNPGDQPDKILFEKATNEIKHARYDVGRLTLQTLINTYPDSEYLAKAKLVIADSYYNEGGMSGLTQAEAEYKDFITFFPTAPEAPEAQFRVGMAHFRLMAKSDRDREEAKMAEAEFKEFLLKYPESPLTRRVKGRLREVQEVLGQSDFKIARFYFDRGIMLAAKSRFQEIVEQYPSFSRADTALWYLGQSFERIKKPQEAVPYYAQILSEHPLSPHAEDAKQRLVAMHQPIPRPTKATRARAKADQFNRAHRSLTAKLGGGLASGPDTSATRHGPVSLGPAKPPAVEVAKAPTTTSTTVGPGNTIVVKPATEASLNEGKGTDPKPPAKSTATTEKSDSSSEKKDSTSATTTSASSEAPPPAKKKSRRSFFKKLIKPF